jgi:TatD DNase family protein
MQLTDTHCHIHSADYGLDADEVIAAASKAGVTRLLCVGTDLGDSQKAVEFVQNRQNCWATIGLHPHEASRYADDESARESFTSLINHPKVVAVGECGLDYYQHSPKPDQQKTLRFQLELALEHKLPLIFHVREAFADFWPIFDEYEGIKGVVHSFSAGQEEMDEVLRRDLYVGLNGIMTFTKDDKQLAAAKNVPLQKLLLETDAPYLTPVPYRGTICKPEHVKVTAEFLADLRGESPSDLATATTNNAKQLFRL